MAGKRQRSKDQESLPVLLTSFGDHLRRARTARGIRTQGELASRIGRSQSFVAQLEAGNVPCPDPALLRLLGEHLQVEYGELVNVYVQSRFGITENASVQKAVGLEIRGVLALAAWEKSLPTGELWIVVRNFVDQDVVEIQDAVTSFVKREGKVTYFSDNLAEFEGAKAAILARAGNPNTRSHSKMEENIRFEYVPRRATYLMMAGVVLYNPHDLVSPDPEERQRCEAFLIVNDGASPDFGIRITSEAEMRRIYNNILAFKRERGARE